MMIQFRLKELIAEKERREGVRLTYRIIKDETGINLNTITAMANNKMQMVGLSTIDRLTDFFDCDVGDLMVKEDDHVQRPKP